MVDPTDLGPDIACEHNVQPNPHLESCYNHVQSPIPGSQDSVTASAYIALLDTEGLPSRVLFHWLQSSD
jgi:hypothetical protein